MCSRFHRMGTILVQRILNMNLKNVAIKMDHHTTEVNNEMYISFILYFFIFV